MESNNQNSVYKVDESTSTSLHENDALSQGDSIPNGFFGGQNVRKVRDELSTASKAIRNSNSAPYVFGQDVVKSNKSGVIGIVSEVAGDSDSDESVTDDEDDEDTDDNEEGEDDEGDGNDGEDGTRSTSSHKCSDLEANQARVLRMDDTDPVQYTKVVNVVGRGFLHGYYVAAASDPTGQDFEEIDRDHFRRRGYYILTACDAYMKGYLIGSLNEDAFVSNKDNANSTSVGFTLMLSKIVSKLFLAPSVVGADCHEFKHLQLS